MILLFTGMHLVIGYQLPLHDNPTIRSGYEAIPGETITTTTEQQSEQTPLVAQTQQPTRTTSNTNSCLYSFSNAIANL